MTHSSILRAQLEQAAQRVLARRLLDLRSAAERHVSVENLWLHRDLVADLGGIPDVAVAQQVAITVDGSTKIVDLVLTRGEDRLFVELKVFVANYGLGGKCVTNSRDAIRADLRALSTRVDAHTDGCVVWLAYPIPSDRDGDFRVNHLRPIARASANTRLLTQPINVGSAYAHAYISDAAQAVDAASRSLGSCRTQQS